MMLIMPNTKPPSGTSPVFIRFAPTERTRLRVAAAEESMTYGELVIHLLDMRDERKRRVAAASKHPGHIPSAVR